jgi:polysaccharide export outer membrane protein
VAANHLETRRIDYQREEEALQKIISHLTEEIAVTGAQVAEDEKSYKAEMEELARLTALGEKGVVSQPRLADARRDLLSASTRVLMGTTRLHDAKRQKTERQLQLYKLAAERKAALHQELETATARLNDIQARLRGTSEKLRFLGGNAYADREGNPPLAAFVVRRRTSEGLERLVADEDFELLPGDVVDVAATGGLRLTDGLLDSNALRWRVRHIQRASMALRVLVVGGDDHHLRIPFLSPCTGEASTSPQQDGDPAPS